MSRSVTANTGSGMQTEVIEAHGSEGTRLRLDFTWLGDRYGHCISRIDASGAIQPLLESMEGSAPDDWPPSPPLQSLTIEPRSDGRHVALLLGMAGNAHWSASVEAAGEKASLTFDIACRHSANPGALGSRYRCLVDARDQLRIQADLSHVVQQQREIDIRPNEFPASSGTTRWRFEVSLT